MYWALFYGYQPYTLYIYIYIYIYYILVGGFYRKPELKICVKLMCSLPYYEKNNSWEINYSTPPENT